MIDISNGKNHLINTKKIDDIIHKIASNNESLYNYGNVKGDKTLRKQIADIYNNMFNAKITEHNIIITNGSQQSLGILLDILKLNKHSTIYATAPFYYGIRDIAELKNIKLKNYSTDNPNAFTNQICYITPYFNNPDGRCITQKDITQIKKISKNNIIIEDDPYSFFSFKEKRLFPLFAKIKNVVYLGTFSKTIAPSMSVGYIICKDKNIIDMLYKSKKANTLHTSAFVQKVVSEYINDNFFDEIKQKTKFLKNTYLKLKLLTKKYFGNHATLSQVFGGYFTVLTFDKNIDNLKYKVDFCYDDLQNYHNDKRGKNQIRINLSLDANFNDIFANLSKHLFDK